MSEPPKPLPPNVNPGPLASYGGYVYTIANDSNLYKLSTTVGIQDGTATPYLDVSVATALQLITIYNNPNTGTVQMYISDVGDNNNGNGRIYLINDLNNPTTPTVFVSGIDSPRGLQVDNGYLYVVTITSGTDTALNRYLLTNITQTTTLNFTPNDLTFAQQLVIVASYCYIINASYNTNECYITQVDLTNFQSSSSYTLKWINLSSIIGLGSGLDYPLVYNNGYLYFCYYSYNSGTFYYNYMGQIDINSATVVTTDYFPDLVFESGEYYAVTILNNNFYMDFWGPNETNYDYSIYGLPLYSPSVPCFGENTKILCFNTAKMEEEYVVIQHIRPGTLVKTVMNSYVRVDMIGKSSIKSYANDDRIKNRLYKCTKESYPEITGEDLILTGCHSILVDYLTDEQREKTIQEIKQVYVTDRKYRLFTFLDPRAEPYQVDGELPIYHIALENENYYMNYGIYANGLLVESCSKRYLKELSGMTLIE